MQSMQSMQGELCFEPKFEQRVKKRSMQNVCDETGDLCKQIPPVGAEEWW